MKFESDLFYGCLLRGDVPAAMEYLSRFPEESERLEAYRRRFDQAQYQTYDIPEPLNAILRCYQQYYREVFYLRTDAQSAEETLRRRLQDLLSPDRSLDDLEETVLPDVFRTHALHFLGGRTGGWRGPYVWRTTEDACYQVALPEGIQSYTVRLLDGFVTKSWLDHLSFGTVTPGGWTDGDGVINCIRECYDMESEAFTVSLLKHEAQHAMDLRRFPDMSSADVEYRAKLVELIYSESRNLLPRFLAEADDSNPANGHAMAAHRIAAGFSHRLGSKAFEYIPIAQVQSIARELFLNSTPKAGSI